MGMSSRSSRSPLGVELDQGDGLTVGLRRRKCKIYAYKDSTRPCAHKYQNIGMPKWHWRYFIVETMLKGWRGKLGPHLGVLCSNVSMVHERWPPMGDGADHPG